MGKGVLTTCNSLTGLMLIYVSSRLTKGANAHQSSFERKKNTHQEIKTGRFKRNKLFSDKTST